MNQSIYENILDVRIKSSSSDDFECYVACKRKIINQIVVFDYAEYLKKLTAQNNKKSSWEIDRDLETRMSLNFSQPTNKQTHVTITRDFQSVVFTDPNENFVLEKKDGYTVQKKLTQLEEKVSHFTVESPESEKGFYFVECKDYDKSIKIIQSNREKKICKIIRNSEPDIIKVFDMKICIEKSEIPGYKLKFIRILMLRDDEFIYDFIRVDEKIIDQ